MLSHDQFAPLCASTIELRRGPRYLLIMNSEFASLFQLARAERPQLVEDLRNGIVSEEVSAPISDAKRDELRRRKDHFIRSSKTGFTWDEVKALAKAGSR